MQDAQLVGAIVEGDRQGWAELYERYADPLYTYCVSQLQDREAAADVLHDTLLVATERVAQLRDPDRLRPWLYAIARNECHRRRRSHRRLVALEEAGDLPAAADDLDSELRLDELRRLVRDAVAGLNPTEREVLELAGTHGLTGADLAAALDVSVNHANALLSRARQQFEKSLGALVIARTGREACAALDDMLRSWDGRMTPLLRKRIARHIDNCRTCGENKRRRVNAKQLLALIPLLVAADEIGVRVARQQQDPELVSYRRGLAENAGPYRRDGFPVSQVRRYRPPWITIAAVSVLIIALGVYTLVPTSQVRHEALPPTETTAPTTTGDTSTTTVTATTITTTTVTTTTGDLTTTTVVTTTRAAAVPPKTVVVKTTTTTTPTTTSSSAVATTTTTSSSNQPLPGTLGVSQREINLDLGPGVVTVSSKGGTLAWSAASANPDIKISPSSGTLAANGSVATAISLISSDNAGGARVVYTATGGQAITVSVSWSVIS